MYKINIIDKATRKIVKSKKYERLETFLKWKNEHTERYSSVYDIICFKYIDGNWKQIK